MIVGPTGVGKSDLAIAVAQHLGGEVINADAAQLYRGMDIGTAKVPTHERAGVPHHLLDVLDVWQTATVAQFQQWARAAVDEVRSRGRRPIVVGGSSLYLRAVTDDLAFPGTDPDLRRHWEVELQRVGAAALHEVLRERDPSAAAEILPSNGRRIVRALEVIDLTGQPFRATMPPYVSVVGPTVQIGLSIDRAVLDRRLSDRVDRMWGQGLVEEVRGLREVGLGQGLTAARALGYRQVLDCLNEVCTEAEARADTIAGTRRFARRQERMFAQDPRTHWLAYDRPDLVEQAAARADLGGHASAP